MESDRVVIAGLPEDGELELSDDDLEVIDEGEIGGKAVSDADILEATPIPSRLT